MTAPRSNRSHYHLVDATTHIETIFHETVSICDSNHEIWFNTPAALHADRVINSAAKYGAFQHTKFQSSRVQVPVKSWVQLSQEMHMEFHDLSCVRELSRKFSTTAKPQLMHSSWLAHQMVHLYLAFRTITEEFCWTTKCNLLDYSQKKCCDDCLFTKINIFAAMVPRRRHSDMDIWGWQNLFALPDQFAAKIRDMEFVL